ncbi:lytic transglycosylase [Clostridium sulfidigenes]|uniref:Lytic transglycosylase n=1 Tax=Clostridium sulfidigenes TaxID=318464 RepID=A0A084JAE7_9CLOT|nr:lytic transglycosylase domain-containing protein [Clostridium sulfidigenes]KEZ85931.1 lytic transglycosylase [Clostridium sulfidigenes]
MTYKSNKRTRKNILIIVIAVIIIVNFKVILKGFFPLEYEKSIIEYSEMYNVDPNLVAAVINTESKFAVDASSSKGAIGLMQIMPDTGKWIAEKLELSNFNEEIIADPEINIRMGTWYLKKLSEDFNGDYILVLAAYNGGPGNVTKWLEDEKYSSDGKKLHKIPFKETKSYVQKVKFNHRIYKYLYNLGQKAE